MLQEEQRQQFVQQYNALCQRLGFQIKAVLVPTKVGEIQIGVQPQLEIEPIQGWQASTAAEATVVSAGGNSQ